MPTNLGFIKTIRKILVRFLLVTTALLLLLLISLQFGKTQLFIVQNVFDWLQKKYDVSFQVGAVKIKPLGSFYIQDVLIKDHHQDTLIYVQDLKGRLVNIQNLKNNELSFKNVTVKNGWVKDHKYINDDRSNLTIFSSSFKSEKKKSNKPFSLNFKGIAAENLRYLNIQGDKKVVDFHQVSGIIQQLSVVGANVSIETDSLSFKDIYGIDYQKIETEFSYTPAEIRFKNTHLTTTKSDLYCDVSFFANNKGYANFVEKVEVKGDFKNSKLSLEDINKIYPYIEGKEVFDLTTKVSGTLNDLDLTKTELIAKDHTAFIIGDFTLTNSIHNRDDFWFQGQNASIEIQANKLTNFVPTLYHKELPKDYFGMKQLNYIGDFYTSKSKVVLKGEAITNLGKMNVNGYIKDINQPKKEVEFKIFHGFLPENPWVKELQKISFKGSVNGTIAKENLVIHTDLSIKEIQFRKNKIKNSTLKVQLNNSTITSNLKTRDSLLSLEASLKYFYKGAKKDLDLTFKVQKAKLSQLFPDRVTFQKNVVTDGALVLSQNKDSIFSKGVLHNLRIDTQSESLQLNEVGLYLLSKEKEKQIQLNSKDLLELGVRGDFDFSDLEKLVANALYKFIPGSKVRSEIKQQTLSFNLNVYPKFAKSLTDKIQLDDNLKIYGVLDTNGDTGLINASLPAFSSKDIKVDSLKVVLDNSNQWLNSNISVKKFQFKKQLYEDLSLLGKKVNDTLFVRSDFSSDKIDNRAIFYLTAEKNAIALGIENVYLKYLNSTWKNKEEKKNKVYYNYKTKEWYFYDLSFANKEQEFDFDGSIKSNKSKNLRMQLKNIRLEEVMPAIDSLEVGGVASGRVFFNEKNNLLRPNGNLFIDGLTINKVPYGSLATSLKPSNKKLGYNVDFNIYQNNTQNISAKGEIIIDKTRFLDSKLQLNVMLKQLNLNSLSPLGRNVLSSIRGEAEGRFKLTGKLNDFNSNGVINLKNAGLKFPYLNIDYDFKGDTQVLLEGKKFVFKKVDLLDKVYKTKGTLTGQIDYDKYNNWMLDLDINSENLLVLNTEQQENSKYYGTAFIKGKASIKGPTSNLEIDVAATTLKNSTFVLPISDVKETENNRFIFYKEREDGEENDNNLITETGISVHLDINVTKDAFGEVVIDQTSGSSLQARADGRLIIDVDRFFNISMYGGLAVDEGMYIYKYGGIVNKPFVVKKGGTVSWDGDPYKAQLNIEALHSVKANPKVLLENLSVNRKIEVDLITKVTGELFDSKQKFYIEIPNASSTVKSELDFVLNTDDNSKMRQFFSLLVTKSFYDENAAGNTGSVLSSTTSDIISNAITQIFNNGDSKLQVNFDYTAGQTADVEDLEVDNQIDIGVATEINDRILINGKLGVPVGTSTQSAVIGEVKIEFLINKDGTLRSSVFNRQNEIQYSEEDQGYTQGIGLNYQINFNNLREMMQKIGLRRKKKKKEKKQEPKISQEIEENLIYVLPTLP